MRTFVSLNRNASFNSYIGNPGELTVDPDTGNIAVHDGETAGGNPINGNGGSANVDNDGNVLIGVDAVASGTDNIVFGTNAEAIDGINNIIIGRNLSTEETHNVLNIGGIYKGDMGEFPVATLDVPLWCNDGLYMGVNSPIHGAVPVPIYFGMTGSSIAADTIIFRYLAPCNLTVPNGFNEFYLGPGYLMYVYVGNPPAASYQMTMWKGFPGYLETQVGTINIETDGSWTATTVGNERVQVSAGNMLWVKSGGADGSIGNIAITFLAIGGTF